MTSQRNPSKLLILVVDLDDDLGREGVETPVVGYNNVLKTTIEFGLKRPSDPDLNALFQALKTYNAFKSKYGGSIEIAVVAGDSENTANALLRINSLLEELKRELGFTDIYLVSDGVHDEQVIPILYNYGRLIGVERVVVTQSMSIERSYILFGKYLKKALTEQPYTRYFLGMPGLMLILYTVASLIGVVEYVWQIILLIAGIALFVYGFGFYDNLKKYWSASPLTGFLYGASILLLAYSSVTALIALRVYGFDLVALKYILTVSSTALIIAMILYITCGMFYKILHGEYGSIWREALILIPVAFFAIFIVNLNAELSKVEEAGDLSILVNLLSLSTIYWPLMIGVIFTVILSVVFTILDSIVSRGG